MDMADKKDVHTPVDDDMESSPMAFTIQFDDPKPDSRKLKIHDRLSSFAMKHRRNPSLPDFKTMRTSKSMESAEPGQLSSVNISQVGKQVAIVKAGYHSEGYFSSDQDEESIKQRGRNIITRTKISPVSEDVAFPKQLNGAFPPLKHKQMTNLRRNSMNDLDLKKIVKHASKLNDTYTKEDGDWNQVDLENKSDTVSEAGTYTVDKDESPEADKPNPLLNKTITIEDESEATERRKSFTPENHNWINDWVKRVAEESFLHPSKDQTLPPSSASGGSSPSVSKIPSPVNTLPKIRDSVRRDRPAQPKANGPHHRRSSSLSAKDISESRMSDSSLETESYLRTTESVMAAMQNRMKSNLKLNLTDSNNKKATVRKERLHPPSTASDTDTNSENESKGFKKPLGSPFTSARLNRAFSLRRARADEAETMTQQKRNPVVPTHTNEKRQPVVRSTPSPQAAKPKNPTTSPFARTDCGRFSIRSLPSASKSPVTANAGPRKDVKKTPNGARSNSSLSSREVEFQNWKRRKSFDPMKAAAEGRKKEAAKKAALSHSVISPSAMTQSVNLGTTIQTRNGNPVLRSASFHSSLHPSTGATLDLEDELSQEEDGSIESSSLSNQPALPHNSPTKLNQTKPNLVLRPGVCGSRGSLNSALSETHSSPSRRARSELIDNLLVSAISDISVKLKLKSGHILKKLDSCCEGDDRLAKLREDLSGGESQRGSASSSPARKTTRDFPAILKNLKSIENVLQLLDDVLFGDDQLDDD